MSQRHGIVCASYVILRRDDQVLLIERKNTGWKDGWYTFPAGHVEEHESPLSCAIREAKEEVDVQIDTAHIFLMHTMSRPVNEPDRLDFYFVCDQFSREPRNMEPEKCGGLVWASIHDLPELMIPSLRQVLQKILVGSQYSEWNSIEV